MRLGVAPDAVGMGQSPHTFVIYNRQLSYSHRSTTVVTLTSILAFAVSSKLHESRYLNCEVIIRDDFMLRIADVEFHIVSCRFQAYCLTDKMVWDIEVDCAPNTEGKFHYRRPNLSLSLFETCANEFSHWTNIAPRQVCWVDKHDTDVTPSGMLYIFEHEPIFECNARCYVKDDQMYITLNGKCDVHYDEEYSTGLELHLDAVVVFDCVMFGRSPESACRQIISEFLKPEDFVFSTTEDGVSILVPK